jgi:hypothetical protein
MASVNIYNSLTNSLTLGTYSPLVVQDGGPDLSLQQTRYIVNTVVTLVPGTNAVDTGFWSNWSAANVTSTLLTNNILHPA